MDRQFLWFEGEKPKSSKRAKTKNNRKVIKPKGFFSFLASMLKLKVFYTAERPRYDPYKYN